MKRMIRYRVLSVFFLLYCIQLNVKASEKVELFPEPIGAIGVMQGTSVNMRQYPDIQAKVTMRIKQNTVRVIGQNKEWYQIKYQNDEGWVYKPYIKLSNPQFIPYAKVVGEEIVDYGLQFLGTPYVWGGSNLEKGVDCSGFTQEVYRAFDIDISRVSYMQAKDGPSVAKRDLRCGDLVFFDTTGINNGRVSHVGIYMDNNKFLHSDGTHGVMVSDLNSPYYTRNYVKGIRVLEN